ncbi:hypothetical protein H6F75_11645 [Nodosilinea sp. FACHB-131]|nr:hypothetical protein [Nodosilinea sp. FACHB-131]
MQEDYAFSTTPTEIDRLIEQRQQSLNQLIESLGIAASKQTILPIVQVTNDVARETSEIAQLEHSNLIVMGWHRPVFDQNRLGGRVGQVLSAVPKDVAVFVGQKSHFY